jgi:hypothetical protein
LGGSYGIPPLAVFFHLDSGKRSSHQAGRDRGIRDFATKKSSCVSILWIVAGTLFVFLPGTGTSDLLALLQPAVCLAGHRNSSGRVRWLRRKIRHSTGEPGSASGIGSRGRVWRTPIEIYPGA